MKHTAFGIHIALSKYPLGAEQSYIDNLKGLYENYRGNILRYLEIPNKLEPDQAADFEKLYKPAVFHLFSHFDVAFISLVDNFKFPQRVFEPYDQGNDKIKSVSYQILSGSVFCTSETDNNPFFILEEKPEFLKIVQIKINNALLIGNGAQLFEGCVDLIAGELRRSAIDKYVFVNSYNWGEITLLCLDKNPDSLAKALMRIRLLTIEKLNERANDIKANSLYTHWGEKDISHSHLFSETLSYLGVNYAQYGSISKKANFESQLEWQIKPGHFPFFAKEMKATELKVGTDYENVFFKNGKTDYIIKTTSNTIKVNQKIFNSLRNNKPQILSHIRRLKTKPLFKLDAEIARELDIISKIKVKSNCSTESSLLKYNIINGKEVADILRKLNVSRNTRKKVNKIIYNYNLGIHDPVLFIYFIDMYKLINVFIGKLRLLAEETGKSIVEGRFSEDVVKMTRKLQKGASYPLPTIIIQKEMIDVYLNVFQEALEDRILNNYNYEDINEFSLDVNSSLTSIVSSVDTIIKFFGLCFRDEDGDSIVTTINENETISNKLSVNYNIEHITNVPLIFATLIKEILNVQQVQHEIENDQLFEKLDNEFSASVSGKSQEERDFLFEFLKSINFAYFDIDLKKFYLTFLQDEDLFIFWHWAYAIQCTHLYNSVGYFDERSFTKELFRLILILKVERPVKIAELKCPIPELRSYWDKYFNRIVEIVELIASTEAFSAMHGALRKQTFETVDSIDTGSRINKNIDVESENKVQEFLHFLRSNCMAGSHKELDEFYDDIMLQIDKLLLSGQSFKRASYFRILSQVSYYNLTLVKKKSKGKLNILRRDYGTGLPIEHFLKDDKKWYLDPFGGFFINNYDERKEAMLTNNKMLYLIWHLGTIGKKNNF
ncbi:hypothetical protein D9M68_247200 [compost metagenome]